MFIAVISAATMLVFVFNNYVTSASATVATRQSYMESQLRTDITIENVVYNSTAGNVRIYVRNTGDSTMRPGTLSVFVANEWMNNNSVNTSMEVLADSQVANVGLWDPKEVLHIERNQTVSSGETHKVIIVTPYGVKDEYEFSV